MTKVEKCGIIYNRGKDSLSSEGLPPMAVGKQTAELILACGWEAWLL
ncbi:MAG: hypothetical protein QXX08_07310 [Candidatus Bathyarchaeia archaeon]